MKIIKNKNINIDYMIFSNQVVYKSNDYILSVDEEDITTSNNIELLYNKFQTMDYVQRRDCYKYLALNFHLQSIETKEIICQICAIDINVIINFYMSKGMTLNQSQSLYIQNRSIDIKKAAECFGNRINTSEMLILILKHLGQNQAETFLDAIRNFLNDLKESAVLGTQYGNGRSGIMDYLEGTGDYENSGLQNYSISNLALCRKEIKDLLFNGYIS